MNDEILFKEAGDLAYQNRELLTAFGLYCLAIKNKETDLETIKEKENAALEDFMYSLRHSLVVNGVTSCDTEIIREIVENEKDNAKKKILKVYNNSQEVEEVLNFLN